MQKKKLTIGISSCLLGEKVRYDGTSKRDNLLIQKLIEIVTLLPICPEVEIGMPVPRERLQLFGSLENSKMIAEESEKDWTIEMREFCKSRIFKDDFKIISGLILKSKSPSCGIKNVKIYVDKKIISENGNGIFVSVVRQFYPTLPIIDDNSLLDAKLFDGFISNADKFKSIR